MRPIKLVKKAERKVPKTSTRDQVCRQTNQISRGVRSWVIEFKKTRRGESTVLFKDALLQLGKAD